MTSFEAVTGPKVEHWLVNTVAALAVAIGMTLFAGAFRASLSFESVLLGISGALAFGSIDVIYVWRGTIRSVYLIDAVFQGVFLATHTFVARPRPSA